MADKKLRSPGARERRGLQTILFEMETAAHDMRSYKNPDERKRAADIFAGLGWIDKAIAAAGKNRHAP
jgi:hypothetical protein